MDILLDPSDKKTVTIKSPRYPSKYAHNQDCRWNIEVNNQFGKKTNQHIFADNKGQATDDV